MLDFFFLFCDICGGYKRCACENNTDKGFYSVHPGIQQELCWRYPAIVKSWNKLGWKRPLEVIWSKLVLRASKLDQIALGFVQSCFENLQGWRLHSLSGQSCQWLTTDCECFFLIFSQDFPCCRLWRLPSVLLLWTSEKGTVLSSLQPSFRQLDTRVSRYSSCWENPNVLTSPPISRNHHFPQPAGYALANTA